MSAAAALARAPIAPRPLHLARGAEPQGALPASWVAGINFENTAIPGGMTRYANFNDSASDFFLKHEAFDLKHDGTAIFRGKAQNAAGDYIVDFGAKQLRLPVTVKQWTMVAQKLTLALADGFMQFVEKATVSNAPNVETIVGCTGGTEGQVLYVTRIPDTVTGGGGSFQQIVHESADAAAGDRFDTYGSNIDITNPGTGFFFVYRNARWRLAIK